MRVVLDARWIFAEISGIGRYTRELIREFAAMPTTPEIVLLFDDAERAERLRRALNLESAPRIQVRIVPWRIFSAGSQLRLPHALRALSADVFHSPNWMIPYAAFPRRGRQTACVVTIHDLIPLLFPHFTPRAWKTRLNPLFRRLMLATLRRADTIIVPSEATRRDVLRIAGYDEAGAARVTVIPEAADARFRPSDRPRDGRTILFVGRRDPYKNLPLLIEAFARVRAECPEAQLRVIGPPDPRYPEPEARATELGVAGAIEWSGYREFEELVEAYQTAAVFAMPSRYEGFGLPALEAMACGTPVVCSDVASLPEVVGDAALLVPPNDVEALAAALTRVLREPALAAELRARGLARAASFSWRRAAEETLRVYERAAARLTTNGVGALPRGVP